MAVYVVTWDLNKEKPNYSQARAAFIAQLERYENTKDPGLDSVRFISTLSTARQVKATLREKMDDDDKLFICRARSGERDGWMARSVWDWIRAREP